MKESDIRPQALVDRYIALSEEDARTLFNKASFARTSCVACGGNSLRPEIEKYRFSYDRCVDCGTLFLNPRPELAAFEELYSRSKSSRYWAEVFFPAVAESRREAVFAPRVSDLRAKFESELDSGLVAIDVGAGFGIFLEELRKAFPATHAIAIEPSESLGKLCVEKGFQTESMMAENAVHLSGAGDIVFCFEVLEHVQSPYDFLVSLRDLVRPGGHVYLTTLTADGFDLFTLGAQSFQISPPHHINFLSISGVRALLERVGLEVVEIATPGQLDLEIVLKSQGFKDYGGMFKAFFERLGQSESLSAAFQTFLSENSMSSHMRVVAKRCT